MPPAPQVGTPRAPRPASARQAAVHLARGHRPGPRRAPGRTPRPERNAGPRVSTPLRHRKRQTARRSRGQTSHLKVYCGPMPNEVTDPAVRTLIDAINAGDRAAFFATLPPPATMSDDGTDRDLTQWVD